MNWMARSSRFVSNVFRRRQRGQSLVEFTLMLPVLLILISGVIEIGFMLSTYLDLVDVARDIARNAADDDPVHDRIGLVNDYPEYQYPDPKAEPWGFYYRAYVAMKNLFSGSGGDIITAANNDDMVLSVFRVQNTGGSISVTRSPCSFPPGGQCSGGTYASSDSLLTPTCVGQQQGGDLGWRLFCNQASSFTTAEVKAMLDPVAPSTGYVLVELYYNYHMVLGLPWIKLFVPDPVLLHAYTLMPNQRSAP